MSENRVLYGPTHDFNTALSYAMMEAKLLMYGGHLDVEVYLIYEDGRGWKVEVGDSLSDEPELVVRPNEIVIPYWMTQSEEEG